MIRGIKIIDKTPAKAMYILCDILEKLYSKEPKSQVIACENGLLAPERSDVAIHIFLIYSEILW